MNYRYKTVLFTGLLTFFSSHCFAIDWVKTGSDLKSTTGLEGEIHGAVPDAGLFILTYRDTPSSFVELSLIPKDRTLLQEMMALHRHDRVRISGYFLNNPSPQKHVRITSMTVLKKFISTYPVPQYSYGARVPSDLAGKSNAVFLVHAVREGGHILVVEYQDAIIPIFVQNEKLTQHLYRNDMIRLKFQLQSLPRQPTHLKLDEGAAQAVVVLDSILSKHGQAITTEGKLVLFPKSPLLKFNIFAVLDPMAGGYQRQYPLICFDDPTVFAAVRAKLQAAWDKYPGAYMNGRGKLIHTRLRVHVSGIFNEVDPNQANAQILISSADAVEILD